MNRRPRRDIRQYDLECQRQESATPPKKLLKLSTQSINFVLSITYCRKNCVQLFPCAKIHILRSQFFQEGGKYFKSHRLLDIHRQIHHDFFGKKMITLEGIDVCPVPRLQSWVSLGQISIIGRQMLTMECGLNIMAMLER
jgi:hypothetical protein